MREQRLVFGEEPELYDRARPGYPDAIVEDVLDFGDLDAGSCHALEIGAGTGKATVAFARNGVHVHALEPDPAMAAVARRNCETYPRVEIEESSFEEWDLRRDAFDLVFSAQAWHWVRPEVRCTKAAAALVPGGCLALLWHRVRWEADDPVRLELDERYSKYAPALHARAPGFPGLSPCTTEVGAQAEISDCADFCDVTAHDHPWEQPFDADSYVDRLRTQSDHRLVPPDELERLLDSVRDVVVAYGGHITVPHSTVVVLARRVRRP